MMFTTKGPTAGAVIIEWNVRESDKQRGSAAMWDSVVRLGGAAGTELTSKECPHTDISPAGVAKCKAALLMLHVKPQSSIYLENSWFWAAGTSFQRRRAV
jgi:glucan 1,3-beta-glucosidase